LRLGSYYKKNFTLSSKNTESGRGYRDIIDEGFNEKVTHSSKNRIIASINRLVAHGLVAEMKYVTTECKSGRCLRYWKLTEKGREVANQLEQ